MDLEQYGVWVKAGPEDVTDDTEEMFALSDVGDDIDESTFLQQNDLTAEEEDLLSSLEETPGRDLAADNLVDGEDEPAPKGASDSDDFSLDDLDDFSLDDMSIPAEEEDSRSLDDLAAEFDIDDSAEDLPELDLEEEGSLGDLDDFDDVGAVTDAMTDSAAAATRASFATAGASDSEREPVAGIESELASIKAELQALRRDLAEIRSSGFSAEDGRQSKPRDLDEADIDAGFFEEDEDETIALTDDELDNILNTAEFTEEFGQPSEVDEVDVGNVAHDEPEALQQEEATASEPPRTTEATTGSEQSEAAVDEIFLEELDDEEMLGVDNGLEETAEPEDASLHQGDMLAPSFEDEEITLEDDEELIFDDQFDAQEEERHDQYSSPDEAATDEAATDEAVTALFTGTNDDLETLAAIDIDTELAEIEELRADAAADVDTDAEEVEPADDLGAMDSIEIDVIGPEGRSDALAGELSDERAVEADDEETHQPAAEEHDELELNLDDIDDEDSLTLDDDEGALTLDDGEALTPTFHTAAEREVDDMLGVDLDSGPEEPPVPPADRSDSFPSDLRDEIRSVLQYMDQLLESLPEEKIEEFARSEHFEVYKRLFEELGLDSTSAT